MAVLLNIRVGDLSFISPMLKYQLKDHSSLPDMARAQQMGWQPLSSKEHTILSRGEALGTSLKE